MICEIEAVRVGYVRGDGSHYHRDAVFVSLMAYHRSKHGEIIDVADTSIPWERRW